MNETDHLARLLERHSRDFHPVVSLDKNDKVARLDLSATNNKFTPSIYRDAISFSRFIEEERAAQDAKFLVGGYREKREMYKRSELFDRDLSGFEQGEEEPRNFHLGVDIWGPAGTRIFAPLGGMIHSLAFNNNFGDYGATIILQHQIETTNFYCLYGHLSLKDLDGKRAGQFITRGENFAHFGPWEENGNWPPHLHFQVILDMGNYEGDFPGVCKMSEAKKYLKICPDPNLILQLVP